MLTQIFNVEIHAFEIEFGPEVGFNLIDYGKSSIRDTTNNTKVVAFRRLDLLSKKAVGLYTCLNFYFFNKTTQFSIYTSVNYNHKYNLRSYSLRILRKKYYIPFLYSKLKATERKLFFDDPDNKRDFTEYFKEELPIAKLQLSSFAMPMILMLSSTFGILPFYLGIGTIGSIEYFVKTAEMKQSSKHLNVYNHYNNLIITPGMLGSLDIYFIENLIRLNLMMIYYFTTFKMYLGKNNLRNFVKQDHHAREHFIVGASLKINILSIFMFPEKQRTKYKKAIPVGFS